MHPARAREADRGLGGWHRVYRQICEAALRMHHAMWDLLVVVDGTYAGIKEALKLYSQRLRRLAHLSYLIRWNN